MRRYLILLAIIFVASCNLYSQNHWDWSNPKPSGATCKDIHFVSKDIGYIINSEEILITIDGGNEWRKHQDVSNVINDIEFYNSVGFIGGFEGYLLKSINNGLSWEQVNTGITDDYFIKINMINEDTVFILSSDKILKSFDSGKNWFEYPYYSQDYYQINDIAFINSTIGFCTTINEILKTEDGGKTWTSNYYGLFTGTGFNTADVNDIHFLNSNIGFVFCLGGVILKTEDGGLNWNEVAEFSEGYYTSFFVNDSTAYAGTTDGYIYKTANGGNSWTNVEYEEENEFYAGICSICFVSDSVGFIVGWNGTIRKTIDGGVSWKPYSPTYYDIQQIQFTSTSIGYALGENELIKTFDSGSNWINMVITDESKKIFRFDFITDSIGYAIIETYIRGTMRYTGSYKTFDGGQTWTQTHESTTLASKLYSIEFLSEDTGFVSGYESNFNGIFYKTTDGGVNWIEASKYKFDKMQFINSQIGYASNDVKLYKTIDGGLNWNEILEDYYEVKSFHFVNENIGYVAGEQYANCYKTIDGGDNWDTLGINLYENFDIKFIDENIGYLLGEYVDDLGYVINPLYKTIDGGENWFELDFPDKYFANKLNSLTLFDTTVYIYGKGGAIIKGDYLPFAFIVNQVTDYSMDRATLTGVVTSYEDNIENIKFEYSTDISFSNEINATPDIIYSGTNGNVVVDLTNLEPETYYNYRLKVSYNSNVYTSNYSTFRTLPNMSNIINIDEGAKDIVVYPNPVNNCFKIKSNNTIQRIEIYNINGRLLFSKTNDEVIDISDCQNGVYLIKVFTKDKFYISKIIKK
jgi:photosystem II stability/assembly factor-like uncharacterized protein